MHIGKGSIVRVKMDLLLTVRIGDRQRRISWISLQPDGSTSVGLSDKTFVAPDFKAQNFVWSAFNRETLHYLVPSNPSTLKPIRNPHLTFHPPHDFHLRANDGQLLFEGIGDLNIMLSQDSVVPWIRFVSKPIKMLSNAGPPRNPDRTQELLIQAPNEDCSIGLAIDFVDREDPVSPPEALLSHCVPNQNYWLHVLAIELPGQVATLSWFHQR